MTRVCVCVCFLMNELIVSLVLLWACFVLYVLFSFSHISNPILPTDRPPPPLCWLGVVVGFCFFLVMGGLTGRRYLGPLLK